MKFKRLLLLLSASAAFVVYTQHAAPASPAFEARAMTATLKIFPDEAPAGAPGAPLALVAARNEFAPFQIAVTALKDLSGVDVRPGVFTSGAGSIAVASSQLLLVETVTTIEPSIASPRRVWPDPLPPYHAFDAPGGITRAVWIDLFVPAAAKPGIYDGTVTVSARGEASVDLKISIDVRAAAVPAVPRIRTAFGIGFGDIEAAHNVARNTPEARALDDAYYWFLVDHRLSPYHIPVDFFSDEAKRYLDDPRVNFLRAPFSWDEAQMKKIAERIRNSGWLGKAVFYQIDEPEPSRFPDVVKIGKWLHSIDPDLEYLITTGQNPALDDGQIDIWCPGLGYTLDPLSMNRLKKDVARGKKFWWYTCIGPKWEGSTYFIDDAATAPRTHPWMNLIYGATGILYWSTTHWGAVNHDPWTKTETYPTGNGDGSLLYPGSHVGFAGPVASIRLKMLREGMEDYELLQTLAETLRRAAGRLGAAAYDPATRLYEHAYALITPEGRSNPMGPRTPLLQFISRDWRNIEAERIKVLDEIADAEQQPLLLVSTSPVDNGYTNKQTAKVEGWAEPGAEITVNGEKVALDGNHFATTLKLQKGNNEITITARRGGLTKTIKRIVYKM